MKRGRTAQKGPQTVMMQLRVSPALHRWLRVKAASDGTTMTSIVVGLLERVRAQEGPTAGLQEFGGTDDA